MAFDCRGVDILNVHLSNATNWQVTSMEGDQLEEVVLEVIINFEEKQFVFHMNVMVVQAYDSKEIRIF